MASQSFDVIVVGARCAGAPTAMLLARQGHRVLLVDRDAFPSDTISTHLIHPPGVAALARWGVLGRLVATGCPPIRTYAFDVGPFVITGAPNPEGHPPAYAPRRTVLDKLLVDAAAAAGAEVRERFAAEALVFEDGHVAGVRGHDVGGAPIVERARVVVGADGLHSMVARAVAAPQYQEKPVLQAGYYSYWSGLPMNGRFEGYDRPSRAFAAWPTNDDLTLVVLSWPMEEFDANKRDIEGNFLASIDLAPPLAERLRAGRREERYLGATVPNFFRKPFGPGWALVGDAGYTKDFITAQGITDAFLGAELCAGGLHAWLSGASPFDDAMGAYQAARDAAALPMYEFTAQFASLAPPPPEQQQLMAAVHGNPEAMNGFVRIFSGLVSPAEFFAPENVARILGAAT